MNYIKHLTGFFDRIVQDHNLNPTHISLYVALFQFWNINRFQNPISITRDEVMRISKICSKATYHKCMRELNEKGYIKYEPSFNPFKGSMVILFNFSEDLKPVQKKVSTTEKILPVTEQVVNKQQTSDETSIEQALVPSINYINNTNILNDLNLQTQAEKFENENVIARNEALEATPNRAELILKNETEKEKSSAKKEKDESCHTEEASTELRRSIEVSHNQKSKPTLEIVKSYFLKENFPELEAQKFFNYFSGINWLAGGKTPISNWQATAQNWIINANQFNNNGQNNQPNRANHLNTTNDKDYSEPL